MIIRILFDHIKQNMLVALSKDEDLLTLDQEKALEGIIKFIKKPIEVYKDCATILYAAAGCGKTFLTRYIADKIRGNYTIAGVAPTHKARKVLDKFLNKGSFYTIKTMTVASLLSKLRSHSYIGTNHYRGTGSKINLYELFFLDEASMISDRDVEKIIYYAFTHKRKLIFIGDKYQIPNPNQGFVYENGIAHKADSIVFNIPGFELTTNIRQQQGNPLIPIYLEFRSAIAEKREPNIVRKDNMIDGMGVKFYTGKEDWYSQMDKVFLNNEKMLHEIRIIAYTNDAVKTHNKRIRKLFQRGFHPEVGELLMGYNNIGFPEPYISNGQDYYVKRVIETDTHRILEFSKLAGLLITTKEVDTNVQATLFIPDIASRNNQDLLQELVRRAEKVNRKYSTKADYKKYCHIRNKLIFMENIYKFQREIIGDSSFRCSHPLLFKNVNEVINYNRGIVLNNKLSNDIEEKYGDILNKRLNDDKIFSNAEKLCDQFCIIEKDIDYGYAITSHKSQGSTYKTVFIDEADFDKLRDHYNYRISCHVDTVKEKNQLKYVSFTRPTDNAYVFYREVI